MTQGWQHILSDDTGGWLSLKTSSVFPKLKQTYESKWGWQRQGKDTTCRQSTHIGEVSINSFLQKQAGMFWTMETQIRDHEGVGRSEGRLKTYLKGLQRAKISSGTYSFHGRPLLSWPCAFRQCCAWCKNLSSRNTMGRHHTSCLGVHLNP